MRDWTELKLVRGVCPGVGTSYAVQRAGSYRPEPRVVPVTICISTAHARAAALSLSSPSPPSTILTTRSGSRGCSRWSVALCLGANRCRIHVVLVTNENDVDATKRIMSQAALGEQVEVVAPHANTAGEDAQLSSSHPMMLPFGHRSVMRAGLSQYDLFVYLEADMLMLLPQLQA